MEALGLAPVPLSYAGLPESGKGVKSDRSVLFLNERVN